MVESETYEEVLKGKTLRLYIKLLESGRPWTARELQRELGFSSPSLSLYHLNKLVECSLVEVNRDGLYTITKVVKVGVLRYYFRLGRLLIPRFLLYLVFFVTVLLASCLTIPLAFHPVDILFISCLSIIIAILLWETIWFWRHGLE